MKKIQQRVKRVWIEAMKGLVLWLVFSSSDAAMAGSASANSVSATSAVNIPASASPDLKEFLNNRAILIDKMAALNLSDPQAFIQFQQQNADLLTRQDQLAAQLRSSTLSAPSPLQIPPNASPQLKAYLVARDSFMRDDVAFWNLHLNDAPAAKAEAVQQWNVQKAARIQNIQQLGQAVFAQQATAPTPTLPPLQFPPNASLQLQAFLKARDQLARDEIAFINQHLNDAPETKGAAMAEWRTQNASRIQNLQQLAQAAASSTSN